MRHVSHPAHCKTETGFSLIEVLVATVLLVGSIATLVQVFLIATRANAEAQYATYATVLATQKMEELRAISPPIETIDAVDYVDVRGAPVVEGVASPRAIYERRWTVEPLPTESGAVVVTVTVTRRNATPSGRVQLMTLRAGNRSGAEPLPETP
ncbi:MAG TPA: hypothetical protein VIK60_13860 [Vicinamibacterales bacterium]